MAIRRSASLSVPSSSLLSIPVYYYISALSALCVCVCVYFSLIHLVLPTCGRRRLVSSFALSLKTKEAEEEEEEGGKVTKKRDELRFGADCCRNDF